MVNQQLLHNRTALYLLNWNASNFFGLRWLKSLFQLEEKPFNGKAVVQLYSTRYCKPNQITVTMAIFL